LAYLDPAVTGPLTAGVWHSLKLHLKINSSYGAADGIMQIWYDDLLIFDHADMKYTDPAWTDFPSNQYVWTDWNVGQQIDGQIATDEYRYLNNTCFADNEAALP
jgi:hypothetical protein